LVACTRALRPAADAGSFSTVINIRGVGNLKERDHLGDTDVDRRIILRWIFRKWDVGVWIGSTWLRIWTLVNAVINFQIP
jgi:hypothetical protein